MTSNYPLINAKHNGEYKAREKLWYDAYLSLYKEVPEEMPDGEEYIELINRVESLKTGNKSTWVFITLELPKNWKQDEIHEFHFGPLQKLLDKKWMKDYTYNWEFCTDNDEPTWGHPHIHILTTKSCKNKAKIIQECYNTIKDYVHGPEAIDVKIIKTVDYDKVYNYITKNRYWDLVIRRSLKLNKNYSKFKFPNGIHIDPLNDNINDINTWIDEHYGENEE